MAARNNTGLNEIFDLLAHSHRRYVLYHLTQKSETVDFDTLVASLATQDARQIEKSQSTSRTSIEVQLHHMHLPKLVDADVITFDEDTGVVELVGTNGHGQFITTAARQDGYAPPAASD